MDEPKVEKIREYREEDPSIYKRRYYRVVLYGIDRARETQESFAIKMAMRLKVPMPRVKQIVANIPCTLKRGMSVAQANRLRTIVEEMGGEASVEDYYEVPGASRVSPERSENAANDESGEKRCPECGWANDPDSTHCALCLKIFKKELAAKREESDSVPSPVEADEHDSIPERGRRVPQWLPWIVSGLLFLLLVFLLVAK